MPQTYGIACVHLLSTLDSFNDVQHFVAHGLTAHNIRKAFRHDHFNAFSTVHLEESNMKIQKVEKKRKTQQSNTTSVRKGPRATLARRRRDVLD